MWVRFVSSFDFSPVAHGGRVTVAYKAGTVENVTRECADLALAAGKAEKTKSPREKEPVDGEETEAG